MRRLFIFALILSLNLIAAFSSSLANAQNTNTVVINEVLPNPAGSGTDSTLEWVELFNYGTQEISLQGWTLDGKKIQDEVTILPKKFLVIARDNEAFIEEFTFKENVAELDIVLNNSGETIELINDNEELVDSFTYSTSSDGKSFERAGIDSSCEPQVIKSSTQDHTVGMQNIAYNQLCWPVFERYIQGAKVYINFVEYSEPQIISDTVTLGITFDLAPDSPKVVSTEYFLNGIEVNILDLSSGVYGEPIEVKVYFENGFSETFFTQDIYIIPDVRLNEFLPNPAGPDSKKEWLEIKNFSNLPLNTTYLTLEVDDIIISASDLLDRSTSCLATETLLTGKICTFDFLNEVFENLGSGVAPASEIKLKINGFLVDSIQYFFTEEDKSFHLFESEWSLTSVPTYSVENSLSVDPDPGPSVQPVYPIYFTEIYPSPYSDEIEWVEIYNYGSEEVDITDWYFSEELKDSETCIPELKKLSGKILAKTHSSFTNSSFNVTLNNSGDEIFLCAKNNNLVTRVLYPETKKGESYARFVENGNYTDNFEFTTLVTKGELNRFLQPLPEVDMVLFSLDNSKFTSLAGLEYNEQYFLNYELSYPIEIQSEAYYFDDGTEINEPFAVSDLYNQQSRAITLILETLDGREIEFQTNELEIILPDVKEVLITEIYASPNSGEAEWIEIYNDSGSNIDLTNWYFSEEKEGEFCKQNYTKIDISDFSTKDFFVILNHGISLNNSGDEVFLCDEFNRVVDSSFYPELKKGVSFARTSSENGFSETFDFSLEPTPGEENNFPRVLAEQNKLMNSNSLELNSKISRSETAKSPSSTSQKQIFTHLNVDDEVPSLEVMQTAVYIPPEQKVSFFEQFPIWVIFTAISFFPLISALIYGIRYFSLSNFFTKSLNDFREKRTSRYFLER
ncbi:MAG: hypothetical protein Kow0081_4430 [Candidatus Dojkabacteria bacterium]